MALTTGLASPHAPTAGALYSRIPEYGAFAGIANAGKHVGRDPEASEFAADSPVEGNGFELSVPRRKTGGSDIIDQAPMARNVKKPTPRS